MTKRSVSDEENFFEKAYIDMLLIRTGSGLLFLSELIEISVKENILLKAYRY